MEQLIKDFYTAFQNLDSKGMGQCYSQDVEFEDPAFGKLQGDRARFMWQMLCENAKDLKIEFSNIKVDGNVGSADWKASYTFSRTGRKVINLIHATFIFRDNLIAEHRDNFNLHKWASQALGFRGRMLGWTGFFKRKFQEQSNRVLDKYISRL